VATRPSRIRYVRTQRRQPGARCARCSRCSPPLPCRRRSVGTRRPASRPTTPRRLRSSCSSRASPISRAASPRARRAETASRACACACSSSARAIRLSFWPRRAPTPTAPSQSRCAWTPIAICTARWYCTATACPGSRPAPSRSAAWADSGRFPCAPREHARVPLTLVQADGTAEEKVDIAAVKALLDGDQHFWLDIWHPQDDELAKLSELLDLHPLVRDDLGDFAQRAKADDYPTHTFLVLFGATHDADSLVEVHAVVSEKWLVTVHTEGCPAFIDLRKRTMRGGPLASTAMLTQRVADSLTDSFYPELEQLDERVDALERL